jgi:hemin uptake protein HemP
LRIFPNDNDNAGMSEPPLASERPQPPSAESGEPPALLAAAPAALPAVLPAGAARESWRSEELLGERTEVLIVHGSEVYRLRRTRQDKLILYK